MFSLVAENIALRALESTDLDFLYQCENNINNWIVSSTLVPFSKYILEQYLINSQYDIYTNKQLRLIIETNKYKTPIGAIDLFDFDPYHRRAGVGILIENANNRQKGYANEALKLLIDYAFSHLDLHQLYCNILERNTHSIKLFSKQGFQITGQKKEWIKTNKGWENQIFLQLINSKS